MDYTDYLVNKEFFNKIFKNKLKSKQEVIFAAPLESPHPFVAVTVEGKKHSLVFFQLPNKHLETVELPVSPISSFSKLSLSIPSLSLTFLSEENKIQFYWVLLNIFPSTAAKGIDDNYANYLSLQGDYALFHSSLKPSTQSYSISNLELDALEDSLSKLEAISPINCTVEQINKAMDDFVREKTASFISEAKTHFKSSFSSMDETIAAIEDTVDSIYTGFVAQKEDIQRTWDGIIQIESENHKIDLKRNNKEKLREYVTNLIENLAISEAREGFLTECSFISTSELLLLSEVLGKFIDFYKKRSNNGLKIKMVKESEKKTVQLVYRMIDNFQRAVYKYVSNTKFKELNLSGSSSGRVSLSNFFQDRKFFLERINLLIKEKKASEETIVQISKGVRDALAKEILATSAKLETVLKSGIVTGDYFSLKSKLEPERGEFEILTQIIAGTARSVNNAYSILLEFFSEYPLFYIEDGDQLAKRCQQVLCSKAFDFIKKNVEVFCNQNKACFWLFHRIFDLVSREKEADTNETESSRIESSPEMREFVLEMAARLSKEKDEFLGVLKSMIGDFEVKIRRVGILPIISHVISIFKGIGQYMSEMEGLMLNLMDKLENVADSNKKYKNIVLMENYYYLESELENRYETACRRAGKGFVEAREAYLEEILTYEFGSFMKALKSGIPSKKEVDAFKSGLPKGTLKMHKRIDKHLCEELSLHEPIKKMLGRKIEEIQSKI